MGEAFRVVTPMLVGCALVMLLLEQHLAATGLTLLALATARRR